MNQPPPIPSTAVGYAPAGGTPETLIPPSSPPVSKNAAPPTPPGPALPTRLPPALAALLREPGWDHPLQFEELPPRIDSAASAAAAMQRAPDPWDTKDDIDCHLMESGWVYSRDDKEFRQFLDYISEMQRAADESGSREIMEALMSHVETIVSRVYAKLPSEQKKDFDRRMEAATSGVQDEVPSSRMWMTFTAAALLSAASHFIVWWLSKDEAECECPGAEERSRSSELRSWVLVKVVIPFLLCVVLTLIRCVYTRREMKLMKLEGNEIINQWVNTSAKTSFFGIKDFPKLIFAFPLWAGHLLSFCIEMIGNLFLLWKRGFWEADVTDS